MKVIKVCILLLVFCTIAFASYRLFYGGKERHGKYIHAEYRDISQTITISGIIIPEKEIDVKSTISGVLESLFVKVGDYVETGQAIAKVRYVKDPMEYKRLLKELEVARVRFENAKTHFITTEILYEKKLIPHLEYEQEKNEVAILRSEYLSVQSELNMLHGKYTQKEVSNIITATSAGTILDLPVKEGGSVMARGSFSEGSTIARIADMKYLIFEGQVLEADLSKIHIGMPVTLSLSSNKDTSIVGTIEMISPKGVLQDGVSHFKVTARLIINGQYHSKLYAGCTANATAIIEKKKKVLSLEEKYFHFNYDSVYVEVVKADGSIEKRQLTTGISDGIHTEIVEGIGVKDDIK